MNPLYDDTTFTIRPICSDDEPALWEMLYHALFVPPEEVPLPREIVRQPELARYAQNWGRTGDCGFIACNKDGNPIGAAWLRLWQEKEKGYGYINNNTAELSIAVLPNYRAQGIGTALLTKLFSSSYGQINISLSVSKNNPAIRLYKKFQFIVIEESENTLIMLKKQPTHF